MNAFPVWFYCTHGSTVLRVRHDRRGPASPSRQMNCREQNEAHLCRLRRLPEYPLMPIFLRRGHRPRTTRLQARVGAARIARERFAESQDAKVRFPSQAPLPLMSHRSVSTNTQHDASSSNIVTINIGRQQPEIYRPTNHDSKMIRTGSHFLNQPNSQLAHENPNRERAPGRDNITTIHLFFQNRLGRIAELLSSVTH